LFNRNTHELFFCNLNPTQILLRGSEYYILLWVKFHYHLSFFSFFSIIEAIKGAVIILFVIMNWKSIPQDDILQKTVETLAENGINAEIVKTGGEAKQKVLSLIPPGAEVMNMTSVTLQTLGIAKEITESGKFDSVRNKLMAMNRKTDNLKMQKLGAAPEWVVGSAHAVTQDGKVLVASNTGSQLPAYVYGSSHVIWVVGAQKVVKNVDEGIKRIYEYILPLESERLNKAYSIDTGSFVSKLLIVNREIVKGRISMFIVKEVLGF